LGRHPAQPSDEHQQQQQSATGSSSGRKKKKSKQKDKQNKQREPADTYPAAGTTRSQKPARGGPSQQDDIDQLLQELNMMPHPVDAASPQAAGSSSKPVNPANKLPPLLGIDIKRIRGDDELRRIFGAGVIEAVDRMEGGRTQPAATSSNQQQPAARQRPQRRQENVGSDL
jgi:hypothetical protein